MNTPHLTKDILAARNDLRDICQREELNPFQNNKGEWEFHKGSYSLTDDQALEVCKWMKTLRFPVGYVSNLASKVDEKNRKLTTLKSYDCHVIMERLMPINFYCMLPTPVWSAVAEMCTYFRDICAYVLYKSQLKQMKKDIVLIMNKLTLFLPPNVFNCMLHLVLYLAEKAEMGGPIQYRWLYPFERYINWPPISNTTNFTRNVSYFHFY